MTASGTAQRPPMTIPAPASLRLGEWRFAPELHRIERGGRTVKLEPKPSSLLLLLAENAGRVVSKDKIVESVWDGRFVADSAITRTMAELRRALGDDAHRPRFIETIPKQGYRLLTPPEPQAVEPEAATLPEGSDRSRSPWRRRLLLMATLSVVALAVGFAARRYLASADLTAAGARPVKLAVLPLENLSADPEEDYFASGMTEALITSLAQIDSVGVISRRSVEPFRDRRQPLADIARTLGVGTVVEGSVLKADGRVRVSVQLTDVADDAHLWAQSYERELADVLRLQSEIALSIAQEIRATLSPRNAALAAERRQVDPRLYELYLRGRQELDRCVSQGPNEAGDLFRKVLDLDPSYAPAHAGLAVYYTDLTFFGYLSAETALPLARFAAEKALRLDHTLAEAHLASAFVSYTFDWDWSGAEDAFRRALDLAPNSAAVHQRYAFFLTCQARFDEALSEAHRAVELDPLTASTRHVLGWVYLNAGRYEESLRQLEKIRELQLSDRVHPYESWNYGLLGRYDTALAKIEPMKSEKPLSLAVHAWILAQAGRREEASKLRREIERQASEAAVDPYALAVVHAGLGENDRALDALDDGYASRSPNMIFLKVEPFFQPLRAEPRYRALVREMGLGEIRAPAGRARPPAR